MGLSLFGIMFFLVFAGVITVFVMAIVSSLKTWTYNNNSPRLTVVATVVAKRMDVHHHHSGEHAHHTSSTTYYVTFEVESGDRMELHVSGREYGMLVEGDAGMLSFQGTRYLGFQRA